MAGAHAASVEQVHTSILRKPDDRRALVVMTVGHGIQHFYVAGLAVTYPFIVADLHVSYALLGVVLTASGLVGGLLQGAAGLLRKVRARAILTAQNAGLALATLLAAISPGFGLFGAAKILGAIVSWPQHPVGSAYLSERFPERRATALSWHTAGGSLGTVTIPLLASVVIATAGWRWALAAVAAALALGALLIAAALPPERRHLPVEADPSEPASLGRLLRQRRVLAVLAASTVAAGGRGLGTLSTYIPADLRSGLHLPTLTVGAIFTVVMTASIAGPLLGGGLADRFGRRGTLVATYLAGAGALVGFGYAGRDLALLVPLGVLVGVLAYSEAPLMQAVFSDMTERGVARATFGAFFAISYGVGSLWTALIGWIIDAAGFPAAFATMAASFVVAAAIILLGTRAPRVRSTPAEVG
ncbi:MAG TPA: MFS transporter [Acidimicrobiales bacterium]|nr:MFS transporter [Acidimicrobiales bacterium]